MITAKAYGKLYIAGEYAVLESGHPAIIVALDQYITATITPSFLTGSVKSTYSNNQELHWIREKNIPKLIEPNEDFNYVMQAIALTEQYAVAIGKKLQYFNLTLVSDLDNKDGRKYGFGSSGAVTVATVKAVLKFYDINVTNDLVYKLATLTQIKLQANGSFGDIAASTYGGWIAYSTFDKAWLLNKLEELPLTELVHTQWSKLRIEPLPKPRLQLLIGWTGSPASTTKLVGQAKDDLEQHPGQELAYDEFLDYAKIIVEDMIQAFYHDKPMLICQKLLEYRKLLLQFAKMTKVPIETPKLTLLHDLAAQYHIAAKTSGAGGGDCGIALIPEQINSDDLIKDWQKHGITPLTDVHVHYIKGAHYDTSA